MAYQISDQAKDLLKDVHDFCEREVIEQAKDYDRSGEFPTEMYDKAKEMGLNILEVPTEYGGMEISGPDDKEGMSRVDIAALFEEMARADAGFATTISASGLGTKPVLIAGNDEQKSRVCDILCNGGFGAFALTEPGAGSDPAAVAYDAVKAATARNIDVLLIDTAGRLQNKSNLMQELEKPGRDPREQIEEFEFDKNVKEVDDLEVGMVLPGIVTNITNFGAFVDIGVHQDGLVHISQLSNRFIKDPNEAVHLHQHVRVKVIEVDYRRHRISLSIKQVNE